MLTVFSLEWQIFHDWAPGYHLVNNGLHIANTILLFLILETLFKKRQLSFLTGLVFLIHPLQTEAVTYVSGLADLLSTFFIFLGILFYFRYRESFRHNHPRPAANYWLTLVCYAAAMLSKDTAVIMPAMIALTDFFYLRGAMDNHTASDTATRLLTQPIHGPAGHQNWDLIKQQLVKVVKSIWPFFAIAGLYFLLRAGPLNFSDTLNVYGEANIFTQNFGVRLLAFFRAAVIYFQLLFWPNNLHMERSFNIPHGLFFPDVMFGGALIIGLIIAAFWSIKKYPVISFGIFWFFIRLFPNSNLLFPNSGLIYEHWMYMPIIGIWLIIFWLLFNVISDPIGDPKKKRYIWIPALVGMTILFVFFGQKTIARNNDWQDPITFYNQTSKYSPTYRVLNNLGMAYTDVKQYDSAIETYQKAISIDPLNAVAYHNLANSFRDLDKKDLAVENYEKALALQPDFLFSYNALTQLYLDDKKYNMAIETLERLKTANPTQTDYIDKLIRQIKELIK